MRLIAASVHKLDSSCENSGQKKPRATRSAKELDNGPADLSPVSARMCVCVCACALHTIKLTDLYKYCSRDLEHTLTQRQRHTLTSSSLYYILPFFNLLRLSASHFLSLIFFFLFSSHFPHHILSRPPPLHYSWTVISFPSFSCPFMHNNHT